MFIPDGPSSCPYVTAVGGSVLPKGSKIGDPETSTQSFATGGGFSNIFPAPKYQAKAVSANKIVSSSYLQTHNPGYPSYNITNGKLPTSGNGIYNRAGRGYPDIAASGDNSYTVTAGKRGLAGGTSESAPLVASIFNLINEGRLKVGKKPVGFINPALYKLYERGGAFNDITVGDMSAGKNCGQKKGFSAVPGWDPISGVGTPKYKPLHDYFLSLQ